MTVKSNAKDGQRREAASRDRTLGRCHRFAHWLRISPYLASDGMASMRDGGKMKEPARLDNGTDCESVGRRTGT
jgi:hypothetical protein